MQTTVASDLPFLNEASLYLIDAGGKRFRPMLVLLTGMLAGREASDTALVDAGVIVELVHLSTLYHDDVIDAAEVRRGAEPPTSSGPTPSRSSRATSCWRARRSCRPRSG